MTADQRTEVDYRVAERIAILLDGDPNATPTDDQIKIARKEGDAFLKWSQEHGNIVPT